MPDSYDVGIIGAGAAGMMAAIQCARAGLHVLLLEGQRVPGAKILMSGGTRCNLTNENIEERDFNSENRRIVRNLVRAFSSREAVQFFEDLGVRVILEDLGKYFPESHSARTVLDALMGEIQKLGIDFRCGVRVSEVKSEKSGFVILGSEFRLDVPAIVICTGGLSYPGTGSDGWGYEAAKKFGHSLIETTPALTPLLSADASWKSLSGIAFPARLTLIKGEEKICKMEGDFLITHFGFSGPVVLDLSRHWVRHQQDPHLKVVLDMLPFDSVDEIRNSWIQVRKSSPLRSIKNVFSGYLSNRLMEKILWEFDVDAHAPLSEISNHQRERLLLGIKSYALPVRGVYGYKKAEATAGGVPLSEVDPVSLESRKISGLFFAGEVLDVDGRIGGFNFHWAWASAVAVSRALIKRTPKIS